jgi:hypothetical protein
MKDTLIARMGLFAAASVFVACLVILVCQDTRSLAQPIQGNHVQNSQSMSK